MDLVKEEKVKMKKVIFAIVFVVTLFFGVGAECEARECKSIVESKTINCSSIGLQTWPVKKGENCTNYSIDLSGNKFKVYPYSDSTKFLFVNMSNNVIQTFEAEVGLEIKTLDISSNTIRKLSLTACPNLEKLYAANNTLNEESIKFGSETYKLRFLDLSRNRLTLLGPIIHCKNMSALDVSHNFIKLIPQEFQQLNELENVNFSNNTLKTLGYLPNSIVRLNISRNLLNQINKTNFAGMQALEILDLSGNSIKTVDEDAFAELTALEKLDLSDNMLTKLPSLVLSESVRCVLLTRNTIMDINGEVVVALLNSTDRVVDLRDNPLTADRLILLRFIPFLDSYSGTSVIPYENCTCINVTAGNATLLFCLKTKGEENGCWVDVARQTTTATTISTTTTLPEVSSAARMTEVNTSRPEGVNATAPGAVAVEVRASGFQGLGGAKLSFLGFLLLTFLALLVANCVVGDPVVDERWWEEKLRGDRVIS